MLEVSVFSAGAAADRETRSPLTQWVTREFEVGSGGPIPSGIDGEAVVLDAPVRFVTRPGALRVRIAPQHPGASPAAGLPESGSAGVRALAHVAARGTT